MTQSPIPFQTISAPISASAFLKKKATALDPDDD
jgi:hypothetical protein